MKQSFWALAAAAAFSVTAAFVKFAGSDFGPMELVFYRSVFGMAVIAAFARSGKTALTLRTEHLGAHLLRSVLGLLSMVLWFYTLGKMHFGTNMTLTYTTPLFMAVNFAVLALLRGKAVPWGACFAIALGFAGVVTVLQPSLTEGEFIPALICLAVSLNDLLIYWQMKELGNLGEPSPRIVFYFSLSGAVVGLAGALLFEGGLHRPDTAGLIALAGMSAFATIGQICSTRSFAYGNMLLSSCLGFSAIPFSAVIGLLCFHESLDAVRVAGMFLILCAGVLATVFTKRTEAQEAAEKAAKHAS